ncbi:phosphoadenylylsulfate reductase (thioredoxin) [Salsuginibacillus halophilus]|uniref:Adenosine 5'-phosphosulfate reductase n=1 Tax=Salsuginibacillus halophilus TaxID=517424 RepID=A0A2P8H9R7_9BACI|nr:phosphoadenylyl-sulfate reductase [Salsuginibacillus halophilus]PSL42954.1 phosphoadenylylsulfate reductase (thioredoxin) [Salsuginibacillus halophilus]
MTIEKLTYDNFTTNPFADLTADDPLMGAETVITWAYETYGKDLVYACSFGAEGIVLIDMISRIQPDASIVFLDTGLHFQSTYQLIERIRAQYPSLNIQMKQPELTLEEQKAKHGAKLWEQQPDLCCYIRKVKPLEDALSGVPAWISGLRRDQSPSRASTNFVNRDDRFESIKVCPLIHWSWDDVWNYIESRGLIYNELHDLGYPSIGCTPCTSAVNHDDDSRAGRWQGMGKTECGLHT